MKLAIVVVMLMFLYNIGMTIWKARRLTTTEGMLMAGLAADRDAVPAGAAEFDNYTVASSIGGGRCISGSRACGR